MEHQSLTLPGSGARRAWSFFAGAGMAAASVMTIRHFFRANFPESIFTGSFCDINSFFNCNSSAYSSIAQFGGVPMGWFGLFVGALVVLGCLFPSSSFERTNKSLSLLNGLGVVGLLIYSVVVLKSLCLLCSGYYVFSLLSLFLFWKYGVRSDRPGLGGFLRSFVSPSVKHLVVFGLILAAGAFGYRQFTLAKKEAQVGGVAARVVKEYYSLAEVPNPSLISPFWTATATEKFDEAPIRVIEYADFLCPDCLYLYDQLKLLKEDYRGKINIAFQFFPLEAKCNHVVDKDRHPGACDLCFLAAFDPKKFAALHDEIFENFAKAKDPAWRLDLARRYGVEAGLTDQSAQDLVRRIINTGTEYDKTSDAYAHGIRSTPTLIVNNRMIIGTLPYAHLKAIFESLLAEGPPPGGGKFMENWVELKPAPKSKPKTEPAASKK
jgi:uncharacterized membrane protein/protein-disulfide isomerase